MADRNVSISQRKEEIRDKKEVISNSLQFELKDILYHFNESLKDIKNLFSVADALIKEDNKEGAMDVWRTQVVFAEGIR